MDESQLRWLFGTPESLSIDDHFVVRLRLWLDGGLDSERVAAQLGLVRPIITDVTEVGDQYRIDIAYPTCIIGEAVNIPQLIMLAIRPAEYIDTRHIWLDDVQFPPSMLNVTSGPAFGRDGLLAMLGGLDGRPLLSATVKPTCGGNLGALRDAALAALEGGADGLVDDEVLVDPSGEFGFGRRVETLSRLVADVGVKTGATEYYFPNVIGSVQRSIELVEMAHGEGIVGVVTNSYVMGNSGFECLVDACRQHSMATKEKLSIWTLNYSVDLRLRRSSAQWRDELGPQTRILISIIDTGVGSALLSLSTKTSGISASFLSKLARLQGADGFHCGSADRYTPSTLRRVLTALTAPMMHIKSVMPVVSGRVTAGNVWRKLVAIGSTSMVNVGSSIWTHPSGPYSGARPLKTILNEIPLECGENEAVARTRTLYSRAISTSGARPLGSHVWEV